MDFSDKCRACLTLREHRTFTNITKQCCMGKTFKHAITMLIPEMEKRLTDEDCICNYCCETLKRVVIFVHNCLVIEANFDKCKFIVTKDCTVKGVRNGVDNTKSQGLNCIQATNGKTTIQEINEAIYIPNLTSVGNTNYSVAQKDMSDVSEVTEETITIITEGTKSDTVVGVTGSESESEQDNSALESENDDNNLLTLTESDDDSDDLVESQSDSDDIATELQNNNDDNTHKGSKRDYFEVSESAESVALALPTLKDHNLIVSVKMTNRIAADGFLNCLSENGIAVADISKDERNSETTTKRVFLIGSDNPPQCPHCSQSIECDKEHICKKGVKRKRSIRKQSSVLEKCIKCGERISVAFIKYHLQNHLREEYKEREKEMNEAKLICGTCNEKFKTKREQNVHKETHTYPHTCDVCGKTYKSKRVLKNHMAIHNEPNTRLCHECGQGFKTAVSLKLHLSTHNPDEKLASFRSNTRLEIHRKTKHLGIRAHTCEACDMKFSYRASLLKHIRLKHLDIKPYQCEKCGVRFGRPDYLQRHTDCEQSNNTRRRRRFTGQRAKHKALIKCKQCDKVCKDADTLRKHVETHAQGKKFKCRICHLTFTTGFNRNRHEKIHRDSSLSYKCEVCYKRMDNEDELEKHMRTIHENSKKYECHVCGELFCKKYLMNCHIAEEHNNVKDF